MHQGSDYDYDLSGNMTDDINKKITLSYNHLNLPCTVNFGNVNAEGKITYIYNALGVKVSKLVDDTTLQEQTFTEYLAGGFQYKDTKLEFFATPEGYVNVTEEQLYNYVYNYTDHLGNMRLSYTFDQDTQSLAVLQENHYYPFGMKHSNYGVSETDYLHDETTGQIYAVIEPVASNKFKYKYNGKEFQDELGLNFYDYGARNYDPAIGRWMNIDPLAEEFQSVSSYSFVYNNPIVYTDPTGMAPESSDWIPKIEKTTGPNGFVNGGRVVAQFEAGDSAETLATFLGVSQKEANQLYSSMKSSGSDSVVVPDAIAGPMNAAISDAIMNPENYTDSMLMPDTFETNYNCFECASSIAQGNTPNFSNIEAPFNFSSELKQSYSHASSSEYKFGQTVIRFGENRTNLLGMTSNFSTHAATYLGTSADGTIYTFSKNGMIAAPGVFKMSALESIYGKNQGVGPTKNESGFYNPKR